MATTAITTNSAEAVKLWTEKLHRDSVKESFFGSKLMGSDANNIVHVKNDLEKKAGDRIRFAIRMRLAGAGVTEGQTLEGNEESLLSYTYDLTLGEVAHAVRDNGPMTRQRSMFSVNEESRMALKDWYTEKLDGDCFNAVLSAPTKKHFAGTATTTATLTSSDKLTPSLISKVAAWAKTGGNRNHVPIRPVKISGGEYYVLLVHPDVGYDLRVDTTWQTAQQYAQTRGDSNPIFTGALGVWSNVIVIESEYIPLYTNWGAGSNVNGSQCVFLGAQALCFGYGENKMKIVQKTFDYDRQIGYGLSSVYAVGKPVFNSKDYGSCGVYVARTAIS